RVLITCGGFAKEEQYHWIKNLGHTINSPVPSLFTFNIPNHPVTELMGVSVPDAIVKVMGTKIAEQGPVLITHWGMSGPAILCTSAWAARELNERNYDFQVQINWLGGMKDDELKEEINTLRREQAKQFIGHKNPFDLPRRVWEYQLHQIGVAEVTRWGEQPPAAQ